MNLLDAVLVVAAVAAAVGGYRLGFTARASSWLGMALGLGVAVRVLPQIIERFPEADAVYLLIIAAITLMIGAFIGQVLGLVAGSQLRIALPQGLALFADSVAGAASGALGIAAAVWLLVPTMAEVPSWPADQVEGSRLATFVTDVFPSPPDSSRLLAEIIDEEYWPGGLDEVAIPVDIQPPPAGHGLPPEAVRRATEATVRIQGPSCGGQGGTGFTVRADTVVTNAHVVAGQDELVVQTHDRRFLEAEVVLFDPRRDLAVLHVLELDTPALGIAAAGTGDVGAVFGFPGGDELSVRPYRIESEVNADGKDLYGADLPRPRRVFFIAAALAPGDSGAALVDTSGQVVGVAFAITPEEASDQRQAAFALTDRELRAVLTDADAPTRTESQRFPTECVPNS